MFNDQPAGPLESLTVMADENGRPSMVLARHGNAISFSVLNVGTAFRSRASVNLKGGKEDRVGEALATDRTPITIKHDKSTATINLVTNGKPATEIELKADELDEILAVLGEARAVLHDGVSYDPPDIRNARELVILNPTWRTAPPLHQALNGIILRLRHPGFGWLTFLIPYGEARSLGDWLIRAVQPTPPASGEPSAQDE
jgi:hypothetical protein